jgi:hypothetical protein
MLKYQKHSENAIDFVEHRQTRTLKHGFHRLRHQPRPRKNTKKGPILDAEYWIPAVIARPKAVAIYIALNLKIVTVHLKHKKKFL